jgi:3-oxoacyl-[acyl-carrier-protein] synthase III
MKIESVAATFPSRRMSNENIVDLIRQHSKDQFDGDLEHTLDRISRTLKLSGAVERRWLNEGERPIDFITTAVESALDKAQLEHEDIDLLIYVGIGRGFIEPAQSYLVAHALGWKHAECFDVIDACMSWMRALHIADSHFRAGRYRHIVVVNGEFVPMQGGALYPANYGLKTAEEVDWTFPSYTVGCAATAIVLSADAQNPWSWHFTSSPQLADLCTIPVNGWQDFSAKNANRIGRAGVNRFTSFGADLHNSGFPKTVNVFQHGVIHPEEIKWVFTHTSSYREWSKAARAVGMIDRLCCLYPEYGNLVSASVPAGLSSKVENGQVVRGDRLAFWVGSAGMSFAVCTFRY